MSAADIPSLYHIPRKAVGMIIIIIRAGFVDSDVENNVLTVFDLGAVNVKKKIENLTVGIFYGFYI